MGTEAVLYRDGELRRRGPVGAVAFLDFDQELLAPRYRAAEEALALLSRASRIVGGRQHGGKGSLSKHGCQNIPSSRRRYWRTRDGCCC